MQLSSGTSPEQRQPSALIAPEEADDRSGHVHRQTIGWLGASLPFLVWLLAGLRPLLEPSWARLSSISAYYHTGASPVFVGVLVTLGVYLIAYQGYSNSAQYWDRRASRIAGVAAILVALFPVKPVPKDGFLDPKWMDGAVDAVHLASAAVLLTTFACIALFLFRKRSNAPTPGKAWRNAVYLGCGMTILACLVVIVVLFATHRTDIFWPEAIAIWAFALSWLVKGRADYTFKALARRLLPG